MLLQDSCVEIVMYTVGLFSISEYFNVMISRRVNVYKYS